ncbi:hypothetical protein PGTUg99_030930 [Puccinia graminis f. sp. tritici]|uniref:DUF4219 domain-containing protein n=1 Tax=Puccinia graminis f. sp. tritici TaxID=56615 RepID=A0A5B0PPS6_PUCGR|nr:hypothetical protein PGTUg99_030930 [Puccinia graminis f. sp. tritici]
MIDVFNDSEWEFMRYYWEKKCAYSVKSIERTTPTSTSFMSLPVPPKTNHSNQNTSQSKESVMEKINSTILKTALEAIPKLTADNYTLWKNLIDNMLDIQNLRESLTSENGTLTESQDVQLRTIITSKIDSSIHPNVITHENEKKAREIWKSITDYFASTQPANRARVFNELLDLSFNHSNIQAFICQP